MMRQIKSSAEVGAVLVVLREAVATFVSAGPTPSRVRIEALGVVLEVSWSDRSAEPGPAAATEPASASRPGFRPQHANGTTHQPAGLPHIEEVVHMVTAPTMGDFYLAPEPGAPPFVNVGDTVTVGQPIGLVQTMKLRIPVEADRSGRVSSVLAENGDSVEYGDPLFTVDVG